MDTGNGSRMTRSRRWSSIALPIATCAESRDRSTPTAGTTSASRHESSSPFSEGQHSRYDRLVIKTSSDRAAARRLFCVQNHEERTQSARTGQELPRQPPASPRARMRLYGSAAETFTMAGMPELPSPFQGVRSTAQDKPLPKLKSFSACDLYKRTKAAFPGLRVVCDNDSSGRERGSLCPEVQAWYRFVSGSGPHVPGPSLPARRPLADRDQHVSHLSFETRHVSAVAKTAPE